MKKNSFSHQLCVSLKMINDIMILISESWRIHSTLELCLGPLRAPPAPSKTRAAEPWPGALTPWGRCRSPGPGLGPPLLGCCAWGAAAEQASAPRNALSCVWAQHCMCVLQDFCQHFWGASPDIDPPGHLEWLLLSFAWFVWCPSVSRCHGRAEQRNSWIAIPCRVHVWGE